MNIKHLIQQSIIALVDFVCAIVSALVWANVLLGNFDIRAGLAFFGGLILPLLDSKKKMLGITGFFTRTSALAGLSALMIELAINSRAEVLGALFWLTGNSSIRFNLTFSLLFLAASFVWAVILISVKKRQK